MKGEIIEEVKDKVIKKKELTFPKSLFFPDPSLKNMETLL
jgi:hypothetical protein